MVRNKTLFSPVVQKDTSTADDILSYESYYDDVQTTQLYGDILQQADEGLVQLDNFQTVLNKSLEMNGASHAAVQIAQIATESICQRLGIAMPALMVSTEYYHDVRTRPQATRIALEGFQDAYKKAMVVLKEFFLKLWRGFKMFLVKVRTAFSAAKFTTRRKMLEHRINNIKDNAWSELDPDTRITGVDDLAIAAIHTRDDESLASVDDIIFTLNNTENLTQSSTELVRNSYEEWDKIEKGIRKALTGLFEQTEGEVEQWVDMAINGILRKIVSSMSTVAILDLKSDSNLIGIRDVYEIDKSTNMARLINNEIMSIDIIVEDDQFSVTTARFRSGDKGRPNHLGIACPNRRQFSQLLYNYGNLSEILLNLIESSEQLIHIANKVDKLIDDFIQVGKEKIGAHFDSEQEKNHEIAMVRSVLKVSANFPCQLSGSVIYTATETLKLLDQYLSKSIDAYDAVDDNTIRAY